MCNTHAYLDNYNTLFIVDYTSVVYYTRATSVRSTMLESSAAYSGSFIWIIVCIINFRHS